MLDEVQFVFYEIMRNLLALVVTLLLLQYTLCAPRQIALLDESIAFVAHERFGCTMLHLIGNALESLFCNLTSSQQLLLQRAQMLRRMDRLNLFNL